MYIVPHVYSRCPWRSEGGFTQSPKLELQVVVKPSDIGVRKGTQVSLQDN